MDANTTAVIIIAIFAVIVIAVLVIFRDQLGRIAVNIKGPFGTGLGIEAEESLRPYREAGDRRGEALALAGFGDYYSGRHDNRNAIEYYEKALAISREIGDRLTESVNLGNLGLSYKLLGDHRRAIRHLEESQSIAREIGDLRGEAISLFNSVPVLLYGLGDRTQAIANAEAASKIFEQLDDPDMVRETERALSVWRGATSRQLPVSSPVGTAT